ncbi:uncharacterized protein LOC131636698 [Vicia villosa]|uniref:uncharacterized protein LOC131636698 n=1 Tax=Vicia villosa TaxID=3911 RepID=UPI00273AF49C|nr:uncharacterized protein LOC131636698 [Vicia villosa]
MRKKSIPYCSFQYPSWCRDDKHTQPLRGNQCDSDNSEKEKHACHVCSKGFPSKKALNGHMRMHKKGNKAIPPPPISSPQNIDLSQYLPPRSHNCSKRNSDINTIDNDYGDRKRMKLHGNMVNEKVKEQASTPITDHVSGIDERVKMKVEDTGVEIQDC